MMEKIEKPIPKPRKNPPSALNVIDLTAYPVLEQSTSEPPVDPVPPTSSKIENPIKLNLPFNGRFSSASSISFSSSSSSPSTPPESSTNGKSIYPSLSLENSESQSGCVSPPAVPPPPRLPPHFALPLGPPPPIPPRVPKEKPLPATVDPLPVTVDPLPVTVEPLPVTVDPLPVTVEPLPATVEPPSPVSSEFTVKTENDENSDIQELLEFASVQNSKFAEDSDSYWPEVSLGSFDDDESHEKNLFNSIFTKSQDISVVAKAEGEAICLCGWVLLKHTKKDFRRLWASIRQRQLLFMATDEEECPILGPYDLSKLLFVGKSTENASDILVCLQIIPKKKENNFEILKFAPESNFAYWITLLAKCNCPSYSILNEAITTIDTGSRIFVREGVTGLWNESFIYTKENTFYYFIFQEDVIKELDMRKFTQIKMKMPLADYCNHVCRSQEGPLLVVLDGSSLYIQSQNDSGTKMWFKFLEAQLRRPTRYLSDCRLTSDDIPVVVDKCIKFVSTYGIKQAGLYRRNGPNSEARAIFEALKNDPFGTHLTPKNDETINAIADVLRTFFRQLESPLIPVEIQPELYNICDRYRNPLRKYGPPEDNTYNERLMREKSQDYKSAIETFPKIHYNTLKKLIDHLIEVNSFEAENKASVDNLSRVFGPTIFSVDKSDENPTSQFSRTGLQICVMRDLLENFSEIFEIPLQKKSVTITEAFESKYGSKPRAEGFLIPVHLFEKDNQCFNVQSNWTAEHVIEYKLQNLKSDTTCGYALYEVLKNGSLERRIGDRETINNIALVRWLNWEATDSFLLLKREYTTFNPANTRPFAEDIKISEPGSKSFKTAQLRIESGQKIQQFPKGEKLSKPQKEWPIDETIWFLGNCERKYPLNYPYTCTFLLKSGKYNIKHAGYCVAFVDEVQRTQWLNAITVCQRDYSPIVLVPDL